MAQTNPWSEQWFETWKTLATSQPWQSALDDWWKQASRSTPSPYLEAFENIAAQSRSLFKLAEGFTAKGAPSGGEADWQAALSEVFDGLRQSMDSGESDPQLFWQMPLANWQRTIASMSGMPLVVGAGGATLDPNAKLNQLLSTPGVGYARESHAEQQKLARLVMDFQNAYRAYAAFFTDMNKQALDRMQERLARLPEGKAGPIDSVRELYNLWIDCSEEVYGSRVMTDEYARAHGQMINALMAVKQQTLAMTDDMVGTLNMPTRREMDTLHARFQASRRSEKSLEAKIGAIERREAALVARLDALQREMKLLEDRAAGNKSSKTKGKAVGKAAGKKNKKKKARSAG